MKKYPFKFLDSYNQYDKDIFFGRDEEIEALYEMVFQTPILLIYGASGTGKTSLIQCGLSGKFKSYDWLPLTIRRGNDINASLVKQLTDAGGNQVDDDDVVAKASSKKLTGLLSLIKGVYLRNFRPVYLIFDQFEELYVLGNKGEQSQFVEAVKEILKAEQPVKMIFSIREEYLGYLYDFEKEVPQLLRKKLRIEPMTLDKVTDVIKGINNYRFSNIKIKEDEVDEITQEIFERIRGKKNTLTIQLPYLQVFLDKIYLETTHDENRQADALITMDVLKRIGDIGDVLRNFLEEQVQKISGKLSVNNGTVTPEMTWKILSPFCTLEGTKEPISKKELADRLAGVDTKLIDGAVEEFVNSRILNYAENENLYELAHDSLALRIAEKRSDEEIAILEVQRLIKSVVSVKTEAREFFTEKQLLFIEPYLEKFRVSDEEQNWIGKSRTFVQDQKELEKKKQQEELAKTKKRLRTVYSLLGGALLALIAAGYFGYTASKAKNEATKQQGRAVAASIEANKQKDTAENSNKKLQKFLSTVIGAKYGGGLIAWKDSTGKHFLIAAEKDLPGKSIYTWDSAKTVCNNYSVKEGDTTYFGWHLPTRDELNKLYVNKDVVGGFVNDYYWSSSQISNRKDDAWIQNFGTGFRPLQRRLRASVRPVRDF